MVEYYKYCEEFERIYKEIRLHSNLEETIDGIFRERVYLDERMRNTLRDLGVFYIDEFLFEDYNISMERFEKFGLLTKNKNFLLERGYGIPVRDIESNLQALVAYYPNTSTAYKYRTTPAKYFFKKYSFFNIDWVVENFGFEWVVLVEGMFDAIALRSVGIPAIATMGSELTRAKIEILKMFKKVIAVPDNDKTGSKEFSSWHLEGNFTFVKFEGSGIVQIDEEQYRIKDCDDLVKFFDVKPMFEEFKHSKSRLEKIEI